MSKYIDADRLKETIAENVYPVQDYFNSRDYGMFWTGGIEKAIDEQPTADVQEVKHGHWDGDSCSVCWFSWCDVTYDVPQMQMPYCPNCGAKMDEVSE